MWLDLRRGSRAGLVEGMGNTSFEKIYRKSHSTLTPTPETFLDFSYLFCNCDLFGDRTRPGRAEPVSVPLLQGVVGTSVI